LSFVKTPEFPVSTDVREKDSTKRSIDDYPRHCCSSGTGTTKAKKLQPTTSPNKAITVAREPKVPWICFMSPCRLNHQSPFKSKFRLGPEPRAEKQEKLQQRLILKRQNVRAVIIKRVFEVPLSQNSLPVIELGKDFIPPGSGIGCAAYCSGFRLSVTSIPVHNMHKLSLQ
jgi:hypothetical protein